MLSKLLIAVYNRMKRGEITAIEASREMSALFREYCLPGPLAQAEPEEEKNNEQDRNSDRNDRGGHSPNV